MEYWFSSLKRGYGWSRSEMLNSESVTKQTKKQKSNTTLLPSTTQSTWSPKKAKLG